MDAIQAIEWIIVSGLQGIAEYLSAHVLLCLVPAFFIAGALAALFNKESVTRYLGPDTPKYISYPVAASAGLLIAVCSCTILPLFASIWRKGAGLGPAVTFLFTGPAINLLAILYTGSLIGWDIAAARGILAVAFGITIGVIMGLIFEKGKALLSKAPVQAPTNPALGLPTCECGPTIKERLKGRKTVILFILLIGILLAGTAPVPLEYRILPMMVLIAIAVAWAMKMNSREENESWMKETFFFVKMILPLLLVGVFIAGVVSAALPPDVIGTYLGGNTLQANSLAVLFGVFMYFPTLVEVPVARLFLDLGMGKGPLLAYLLADPELSLQSIIVIRKVIGNVKVLVYVGFVAIFSIAAGLIFGAVIGL